MLTPLFVTQHGSEQQSAGATLNHFKSSGFLTLNASRLEGAPVVYHTVGGVQAQYEMMLNASDLPSKGGNVFLNTEVTAVAPSENGWQVFAHPRAPADGAERPAPMEPIEYDEVIMGVNAHIAARLLDAGGDGDINKWPECRATAPGEKPRAACKSVGDGVRRGFRLWAMRNTEYEEAVVTLSEAAPDDPTRNPDGLYHIFEDFVMTGSIDRVLGVGPGDYRLRCGPVTGPGTERAPDVNPPIAERIWEHHRFNLWEHFLVFKILPYMNNYDGLHIAGDWTQSVGQNAAIRSGLRAACAVGLPADKVAYLNEIGLDTSKVYAC
jgi:hypothetical protein